MKDDLFLTFTLSSGHKYTGHLLIDYEKFNSPIELVFYQRLHESDADDAIKQIIEYLDKQEYEIGNLLRNTHIIKNDLDIKISKRNLISKKISTTSGVTNKIELEFDRIQFSTKLLNRKEFRSFDNCRFQLPKAASNLIIENVHIEYNQYSGTLKHNFIKNYSKWNGLNYYIYYQYEMQDAGSGAELVMKIQRHPYLFIDRGKKCIGDVQSFVKIFLLLASLRLGQAVDWNAWTYFDDEGIWTDYRRKAQCEDVFLYHEFPRLIYKIDIYDLLSSVRLRYRKRILDHFVTWEEILRNYTTALATIGHTQFLLLYITLERLGTLHMEINKVKLEKTKLSLIDKLASVKGKDDKPIGPIWNNYCTSHKLTDLENLRNKIAHAQYNIPEINTYMANILKAFTFDWILFIMDSKLSGQGLNYLQAKS